MRGSGVAQGAKAARRARRRALEGGESMNTVILAVDNMHCGKCVGNVERRYRETPGVSEVEVDLAGKQARVVFDPEVCRIEDLLGALDDTNFKVARMLDDGSNPFLTTKLELAINGMHCEKCVANIEKRYRETPGVNYVRVDLDAAVGVVYYDDSAVDEDALLHVLDDTKFEVVVMPEDGSDPVFPSTARGDDAADGAAGFPAGDEPSKDKALRCLTFRCRRGRARLRGDVAPGHRGDALRALRHVDREPFQQDGRGAKLRGQPGEQYGCGRVRPDGCER